MNFISYPVSQPISAVFRPAAGVSFALIDQRPVLFSESEQKLFELNDIAAVIWCCLLDAIPLKAISDQLINRSLTPAVAHASLLDALNQWLSAGLIVPDGDTASFAFMALIGKRRILVQASNAQMLDLLQSVFVYSIIPTGDAEAVFTVHQVDNVSILVHENRQIFRCATNELAPTFKAYIIERLLLAGEASDVIFHSACLTFEGAGMLISAPPGTGKSTLTMHLVNAGLEYSTDDIVMIGSDGSIRGAPFSPTIKSGGWSLVGSFRSDVRNTRIHDRLDGKKVRYLDVSSSLHIGDISVKWIVFIERVSDGTPIALVELNEIDTLNRIVNASFVSHGKLTEQGFRTLKTIVSQARSFELRYAEATDATSKLIELCNGKL